MTSDDEFTSRLIGFGLSGKEARTYLHLLKYGPKTPSPLAKSLKTYREDVHRTLTALIEKGMVHPSLDTPTIYAAVDLDVALESAVKKQESELREMEERKRELQELAKQQRFRPSDEIATFKVLKNVKEIFSFAAPLISSMNQEMLWVALKQGLAGALLFGINDVVKGLVQRGGSVRGVTDISYAEIELAQELFDVGEEVRHFAGYRGVFYAVFDKRYCLSAINIDIRRLSVNEPASMLYVDDPTYADYLGSTFELLWEQAVPANLRIAELLKQCPPRA